MDEARYNTILALLLKTFSLQPGKTDPYESGSLADVLNTLCALQIPPLSSISRTTAAPYYKSSCDLTPQVIYQECEKTKKYKDCEDRVKNGVKLHCLKEKDSPACNWNRATTTMAPKTAKTPAATIPPIATTEPPSETTTEGGSMIPVLLGTAIGGFALLAIVCIIFCLCRKKSANAPGASSGTKSGEISNSKMSNSKMSNSKMSNSKMSESKMSKMSGTKSGSKSAMKSVKPSKKSKMSKAKSVQKSSTKKPEASGMKPLKVAENAKYEVQSDYLMAP